MAQIGDYVTAKLEGQDDCRQGVLVSSIDGKHLVAGELETYICEGSMTVVADEDIFLPETRVHVAKIRKAMESAQ